MREIYIGFAVYIVLINIVAWAMCVSDKRRAKRGVFRISERMLFTVSLLGGAPAMYLTMLKIRHKTKHKRFMIGLPIIMILQLCLALYIGVYILSN